jgi:RNA polymerase sigma factor (sigma-70 family)
MMAPFGEGEVLSRHDHDDLTMTTWATLRELLVARYDDFYKRLRRRLGSGDVAQEVLHDTYLQLSRPGEPALVQRPDAYLYRIALNVAAGRRRSEARRATPLEIEAAVELVDEAAQTDRTVEARFDLAALERAIEELPSRQRSIFLAARVEGLPIQEIATSFGISRRLVEMELRKALDHCATRLDRQVVKRFRVVEPKASYILKSDCEIDEGL